MGKRDKKCGPIIMRIRRMRGEMSWLRIFEDNERNCIYVVRRGHVGYNFFYFIYFLEKEKRKIEVLV